MIAIYKYPFDVNDYVDLQFPKDGKILKVECQNGNPCAWVMVDTNNEDKIRTFKIYGTGHIIRKDHIRHLTHIATFQQGSFVWHMFEVKK